MSRRGAFQVADRVAMQEHVDAAFADEAIRATAIADNRARTRGARREVATTDDIAASEHQRVVGGRVISVSMTARMVDREPHGAMYLGHAAQRVGVPLAQWRATAGFSSLLSAAGECCARR